MNQIVQNELVSNKVKCFQLKLRKKKATLTVAFLQKNANTIRNYKLSVKVRVITSRCCSGVSELKRTA